jgi:hypothetical protein
MAPPTPPIVVSSDDFRPPTLQRSDTIKTWEDEVREISQARMRLEPDDETGSRDLDFRRSKVDDLNDCVEDENDRERLAQYLPSKIVFEARNQYHDSIRQGLDETGIEALEDGLKLLENKLGEDSDQWRFGKIDLLLDLGRDTEARALLSDEEASEEKRAETRIKKRSVRGDQSLFPRRPSQNRRRSTVNTDAEYEKMLRLDLCQRKLDLALRAEKWDQVKKTQIELDGLDPGYFDIKKPLERFSKIRQLLNIGQLHEREAKENEDDPVKKKYYLQEALRTYNHGCYATELFHQGKFYFYFIFFSLAQHSRFDHYEYLLITS